MTGVTSRHGSSCPADQAGKSATSRERSVDAASAPTDQAPAWHAGFLKLLPEITRQASRAFRGLPPAHREEEIQEAVVRTLVDYIRLVEQGRPDVATAGTLARYAVSQVRSGRTVATRLNVRDVASRHCQIRTGVVVESLSDRDEAPDDWRDALVEDRTCGPADLAASRIDFAAWLERLSGTKRAVARTLATGLGTLDAAHRHGLSPARVSQIRTELRDDWHAFHEPGPRMPQTRRARTIE